MTDPSVVAIGGGHGLSTVLEAMVDRARRWSVLSRSPMTVVRRAGSDGISTSSLPGTCAAVWLR